MQISDHSFANRDAEYDLIKEFLLQVQTYPDVDNSWGPGRMDWWRYNVHADKAVDFFQANAHYWRTEANQVVGLFISEYGDYESRVKLVRNAFDSSSYSETNLRSLHSSPTYLAELDLVIVDARGESVAYCMGWIEENDASSGTIEPMGTHTDYRRNGLATALAKECFKRLRARGVETVSIASHAEPDVANCLYESLHPVSVKRAYRYSLDLPEPRGDLPEDSDHG